MNGNPVGLEDQLLDRADEQHLPPRDAPSTGPYDPGRPVVVLVPRYLSADQVVVDWQLPAEGCF